MRDKQQTYIFTVKLQETAIIPQLSKNDIILLPRLLSPLISPKLTAIFPSGTNFIALRYFKRLCLAVKHYKVIYKEGGKCGLLPQWEHRLRFQWEAPVTYSEMGISDLASCYTVILHHYNN